MCLVAQYQKGDLGAENVAPKKPTKALSGFGNFGGLDLRNQIHINRCVQRAT